MTTIEALQSIIQADKWYKISEDETNCTYVRVTALRILNGTAKPKTIEKFFAKFGYEQNEVTWKKL